jgi:hypothetical protein
MSVADGHETCNMAVDFDVAAILASQNSSLDWKLPKGIAFMFRGDEQLLAQTHYVDTGLLSTPGPGWATFNLYATNKKRVSRRRCALRPGPRRLRAAAQHDRRHHEGVFPRPVKIRVDRPLPLPRQGVHDQHWDGVNTGEQLIARSGTSIRLPALLRQVPAGGAGARGRATRTTRTTSSFGPFTTGTSTATSAGLLPTLDDREFMTCVQRIPSDRERHELVYEGTLSLPAAAAAPGPLPARSRSAALRI